MFVLLQLCMAGALLGIDEQAAQDLPKEEPPVVISAHLEPHAENVVKLVITATIKPDWDIVSITQKPGGPPPTRLRLEPSESYHIKKELESKEKPEILRSDVWENPEVEVHYDLATWSALIEVSEDIELADFKIEGRIQTIANGEDNAIMVRDPFVARMASREQQEDDSTEKPQQP